LSEVELSQIHELSAEQSFEFWNKNILSKIAYYPMSDIIKNNEKIIGDCGWGNEDMERSTKTKLHNIFSPAQEILFFWDPKHAVKMPSDIFVKYWSDFCYCSDFGNVIFRKPEVIYIMRIYC